MSIRACFEDHVSPLPWLVIDQTLISCRGFLEQRKPVEYRGGGNAIEAGKHPAIAEETDIVERRLNSREHIANCGFTASPPEAAGRAVINAYFCVYEVLSRCSLMVSIRLGNGDLNHSQGTHPGEQHQERCTDR
jgi:hypothetical protein